MPSYRLVDRIPLTRDVFELTFSADPVVAPVAGQFITFILPSGLRRSYSISHYQDGRFSFIIKSLPNGGGGSLEICSLPIDAVVTGTIPVGRFVLTDHDVSRRFIGTGTGFAPLYAQILTALTRGDQSPIELIFGVREPEDIIYRDVLDGLCAKYPNFSYTICLSRGSLEGCVSGRVTDVLGTIDLLFTEEYGICGNPAMVTEVRAILEKEGVPSESVFFEQY